MLYSVLPTKRHILALPRPIIKYVITIVSFFWVDLVLHMNTTSAFLLHRSDPVSVLDMHAYRAAQVLLCSTSGCLCMHAFSPWPAPQMLLAQFKRIIFKLISIHLFKFYLWLQSLDSISILFILKVQIYRFRQKHYRFIFGFKHPIQMLWLQPLRFTP